MVTIPSDVIDYFAIERDSEEDDDTNVVHLVAAAVGFYLFFLCPFLVFAILIFFLPFLRVCSSLLLFNPS